ncbi:MAG TPA: hypothetical protein VF796_20325 [Humisphaera sp.]
MADVESNPLFPILTDALRAGPGSPEWHQAVAKLRADGLADSDEYKMLVAVREHLAAGRDYRSIRAGPGFTRKVMEAVDRERAAAKRPSGLPLANIIAVVSVVAVLAIAAFVIYRVVPWGGGGTTTQPRTAADLEREIFGVEVASAKFDGGAGVPPGWQEFGRLALEPTKNGLGPAAAAAPTTNATGSVGRAVVAPQAFAADQPVAVEVKLKPGRPTDTNLIVQVFVSAADDFNDTQGTSSGEFVWLVQGDRQRVVLPATADPKGNFDGPRPDAGTAAKPEPITVRVLVDKDYAVVVANGKKVYGDRHELPAKPRRVGVRFLRVDPTKPVDPTLVQSVSVRATK